MTLNKIHLLFQATEGDAVAFEEETQHDGTYKVTAEPSFVKHVLSENRKLLEQIRLTRIGAPHKLPHVQRLRRHVRKNHICR